MQQLIEHYERQDTEELLEIARKDLTDEARFILQDVLAKRGIPTDQVSAVRESAVKAQAAQAEADKRLAPLGVRLAAYAIDVWGIGIVFFIILMPLLFFSSELHIIVFYITWPTYFFLRDSIPGQSLGKRLLGIRVVQLESGFSCTWSKSFWRNFPHFIFPIEALFALGRRRMRLGDMIAGTVVVRVESNATQGRSLG